VSRAQRDRGAAGEREALGLIRGHGWTHAHRNFQSGGQGGGDITRGPAGISVEVKRTNRLRLREAWAQAETDARPRREIPLILARWDCGPWLAILDADEALALLRLREQA